MHIKRYLPSLPAGQAAVPEPQSLAAIVKRSIISNLEDDPFRFSHGLTGVDQQGNFLWVHVLLICFIGLVFFMFVLRLTQMWNAHLRHISALGSRSQAFWAHNRTWWWPQLKKHFFLAPLGSVRHNREFQLSSAVSMGTLPGRFHTLLLVLYGMSNIAYCLALPWSEGDSQSIVAALRGRSGSLATLNLIPTILFALRNNPLIPLLKMSYDTFNLLHRWAARIVIVEAIIHTACWMANTIAVGGGAAIGPKLAESLSYQWGMVGTVMFTVIFIQAWSPIRHAFYESFLNFHRFLVLFSLIGVYVHLDTHKLPQVPWLQLIFILWGLEWFARFARIAYYNISMRSVSRVHVEALPQEACRLTFQLVRPWVPRPGCHVHVYLPTMSLWSSHPFSIAWANPIRHNVPSSEKLPISERDLDAASVQPSTHIISLVIRARSGFTRKLYDRASRSPTGQLTTWGFFEGPYGGHESLASYGTVLLFAGGVGITHQVNYVRDMVAAYASGTTAIQKLVLVWSVPDTQCLEWVKPWMDEILQMPRRREVLRIMLFITKPRSNVEISSASATVQMFPGRCPVQSIVDREVANREGAVGVTVCGPGPFADSVRAAVRRRVDLGCVDFVEEAFTY